MAALRTLIHHVAENSFTILEKNGDPDDDTG